MIRELKSMCCSLYDEDMFTQMEWHVLNTLEWMVGHPTIDTWLQVEMKDGPEFEDLEVQHMSWYISEQALYHKDFVSKKPSVMARASLALARGILGRPEGRNSHSPEVSEVLIGLSHNVDRPSQVLYRKYASPHMSRVSTTLDHFLRQQELLLRPSPPTPPMETAISKPAQVSAFPGTPQKVYGSNMVNGYMTPPITPDGEYFANGHEAKGYAAAPRCPITPTPTSNNPYAPQQYQQYHEMSMH